MNCKECANRPKLGKGKDEQYYVDIIDAMAERTNKRAHVLNVILSVLFSVVIAVSIILAYRLDEAKNQIIKTEREKIELEKEIIEIEREFETIETVESQYEVEQDASDGGMNYIVGGDYYGETESQSHKENDDNKTP